MTTTNHPSPPASPAAPPRPGPAVRRLVTAQGLAVLGTTVDLTLTGVVGARLAPTRVLATVPFSLIPVAAVVATFVWSRAIGRAGYRRAFAVAPAFAVAAGLVSARAVQLDLFWLFCVGTALVGVYQAGTGYYRYAAAESWPAARARAVSTVLAGGLVAALVGPFLATALAHTTATPYVASYLLVAAAGLAALAWNAFLPRGLAGLGRAPAAVAVPDAATADVARPTAALWRQPVLLGGVGAASLAAFAMMSMMTAGPLAGTDMGHSADQAALAVQLHMVGMYAPGFVVARWIGRFGERRVALLGTAVIVVAGAAAAVSPSMPAFLVAMTAVGVGWNLAFSGGSAMVAASYRPAERGRVQPVAELVTTTAQVAGALSAGALATRSGWPALGLAVALASLAVGSALSRSGRRQRRSRDIRRSAST
ncbi:MFS transporter [Luteimicrobium album]|uniref:MFS transporter n=1 Tax=Luteimicrobium album TaxID=1054550 RepID=UPI0024E0B59D|nr:MFS transporter [Luteimicrobium album]